MMQKMEIFIKSIKRPSYKNITIWAHTYNLNRNLYVSNYITDLCNMSCMMLQSEELDCLMK